MLESLDVIVINRPNCCCYCCAQFSWLLATLIDKHSFFLSLFLMAAWLGVTRLSPFAWMVGIFPFCVCHRLWFIRSLAAMAYCDSSKSVRLAPKRYRLTISIPSECASPLAWFCTITWFFLSLPPPTLTLPSFNASLEAQFASSMWGWVFLCTSLPRNSYLVSVKREEANKPPVFLSLSPSHGSYAN